MPSSYRKHLKNTVACGCLPPPPAWQKVHVPEADAPPHQPSVPSFTVLALKTPPPCPESYDFLRPFVQNAQLAAICCAACPEAVFPARALYLPNFSHLLIVNKLIALSLVVLNDIHSLVDCQETPLSLSFFLACCSSSLLPAAPLRRFRAR
jgi:hypothetical protein